ncbi:speriolin-like protein [Cyprinodon tularosa]|uniref:speriolin-like protein n=1 Tax=Cyprinodon tularosa TaxID=77115 RepID=UPI0018E23F5A|nr:speriolin-like protein [Cyprinodon tularosa]
MSLEQSTALLQAENEQLRLENAHFRSALLEYDEMRSRMQRDQGQQTGFTGMDSRGLQHNNIEEQQFGRDLQQDGCKLQHRTSSPVNFKSFLQSAALKDAEEAGELHKTQADVPPCAIGSTRLLGEIAYQLDRRILSYVFQAHQRLYGFTLRNIPEKIIEVSTHPLTGKMDGAYQLHLTQRYKDIMEMLSQFGYKAALHPPFCEFVVNTYGILMERPSRSSTQEADYNNPEFLKKLIENTAPKKLQKDLLLVLSCLCFIAEKDKEPLLAW